MMRLLQYLSPEEAALLIQNTGKALQIGGLAVISYVVSGAKDKSEFGIQEYMHAPEQVSEELNAAGLEVIENRNLSTVSRHLPYHSFVNVCELVAKKPEESSV
jgi:predicted TPR repeat methyltransferase